MDCLRCKKKFEKEDLIASMSGSIMGDEYTDVYFLCPVCRVFTVEHWRDNFTGTETIDVSGPVDENTGMERIRLIRQCPEPWDKKCRCEAHLAYFGSSLD